MRIEFSNAAIELARELHQKKMPWVAEPGQFVFDEDGVLPHTSPFQARVFFILDLKHFVRYAETVELLQQRMFWLPTWDDCVSLLEERGVSRERVAEKIRSASAIEKHTELEVLYRMILETL